MKETKYQELKKLIEELEFDLQTERNFRQVEDHLLHERLDTVDRRLQKHMQTTEHKKKKPNIY